MRVFATETGRGDGEKGNGQDEHKRAVPLCGTDGGGVPAAERVGEGRPGRRETDLDTFVLLQARKAERNRRIGALRDSADFELSAAALCRELLGETAATLLREVLKQKVICTADHHGSVCCSQFFQADLLFAMLLEKLGDSGAIVPVLAAGQVELENSTYSRGISAYFSAERKMRLPLFPDKHGVQLASYAGPVTREMTDRFRGRFISPETDPALRAALEGILSGVYEAEDVLRAGSFSEQMTVAGSRLTDHLFQKAPAFAYLEMETAVRPLLLAELGDVSSLLFRLLYDPEMRRRAVRHRLPDGTTPGDLLFRAADGKGRKILLSLTEDGFLTGRDWRRQPVCFGTGKEELSALIREKRVFPGVFTEALLLFFERGITWIGGMFQSCYLPQWQEGLAGVLEKAGCAAQAERIRAYDCSGYLCGPMPALYRGDGFATTAGPVELWERPVPFERFRELARKTTLWDAHLIGLSEMYYDLTVRSEREPDWYRKIAEELFRAYPENTAAGVTEG